MNDATETADGPSAEEGEDAVEYLLRHLEVAFDLRGTPPRERVATLEVLANKALERAVAERAR